MKIKMRGLRDFKVPDFKFPKFKMKDISEIEEMNINYDEIEKNKDKKKDKKEFVATNYNSIKEIFEHSIKTYANKEFILEKFDPKGKYEIKCCDGTACHVRGSMPVLNAIKARLELKDGKFTTDDGLFSVETVLPFSFLYIFNDILKYNFSIISLPVFSYTTSLLTYLSQVILSIENSICDTSPLYVTTVPSAELV